MWTGICALSSFLAQIKQAFSPKLGVCTNTGPVDKKQRLWYNGIVRKNWNHRRQDTKVRQIKNGAEIDMKHAYLIIAHNNWWQLQNLIRLLDSPTHDIYVHIDKKSKGFVRKDLENITKHSKLSIYQEIKVCWGGYSQVQTELFLIGKACEVGYDYYHLLSGADLPLRSNDALDAFFEANRGLEFIHFDDATPQNDPRIRRRASLYHFLQSYRRRFRTSIINGIFSFLDRALLALQMVLKVNRLKKEKWTIKYGPQWFSITDSLAKTVLAEQKKIKQLFRFTSCADELFLQTVAYNCGFKDNIYRSPFPNTINNLRLVDWSRGKNGNPYTFTSSDRPMILENKSLFARKFSQTVDKEIIEFLSNQVKQ